MEFEREEKNDDDKTSSKETSEASSSAVSSEEPSTSSSDTLSSLLPKALSMVLHHTMPPEHNTDHPTSEYSATHTSPKSELEQLQAELTVLRGQFEQMKAQHNKEIKLLMNELDEEKRIRLTLQVNCAVVQILMFT